MVDKINFDNALSNNDKVEITFAFNEEHKVTLKQLFKLNFKIEKSY